MHDEEYMKKLFVFIGLSTLLASCSQGPVDRALKASDTRSEVSPLSGCTFTKTLLKTVETRPVYKDSGTGWVFFKAKMAVDADGSPRAYGPSNTGLDYTANAGHPGNWWGVVTDRSGNPVVQKSTDPYPGMYVSTTSLVDRRYVETNPLRFVNSETIPYIGLPNKRYTEWGIRIGDIALVYNFTNGRYAYATFADVKNEDTIGEGSILLNSMLGLNPDARRGGTSSADIGYIVFPQSGAGQGVIPTPAAINAVATATTTASSCATDAVNQIIDTLR